MRKNSWYYRAVGIFVLGVIVAGVWRWFNPPCPPPPVTELSQRLRLAVPGTRIVAAGTNAFYLTRFSDDDRGTLDAIGHDASRASQWQGRLAVATVAEDAAPLPAFDRHRLVLPPYQFYGDPDLIDTAARICATP